MNSVWPILVFGYDPLLASQAGVTRREFRRDVMCWFILGDSVGDFNNALMFIMIDTSYTSGAVLHLYTRQGQSCKGFIIEVKCSIIKALPALQV